MNEQRRLRATLPPLQANINMLIEPRKDVIFAHARRPGTNPLTEDFQRVEGGEWDSTLPGVENPIHLTSEPLPWHMADAVFALVVSCPSGLADAQGRPTGIAAPAAEIARIRLDRLMAMLGKSDGEEKAASPLVIG